MSVEKSRSLRDDTAKTDSLYQFLVALLGTIMVVNGILCVTFQLPQRLVKVNIQKNLELSPNSPINEEWKRPSTPIYMRYYIFNVTNAAQIIKGEKPRVEERGPYTYRMFTSKYNVTYYSNDTVSYYNNMSLIFEPHLSVGLESDIMYHLNIPLATLENMMEKQSPMLIMMGFMSEILEQSGENHLFQNHTVKEILFGYEHNIFVVLARIMSMLNQDFDPVFGFFRDFNNSHDGCYLVNSGRKNFDGIHKIDRWNGQKFLTYWPDNYANMINGTDGSFFGPDLKRTDRPYVFSPPMCRSIELEYEQDSSIKGISVFRFHFARKLFANTAIEPDNAGFCVPPGRCFDSGILNVESCNEGAPAFLSLPHFYGAAERYRSSVLGLSPRKEQHDSLFFVEPLTGAVLSSDRKLQINTLLRPSKHIDELNNVRETIFPILWMSGSAEISDPMAADLRQVMAIVRFMGVSGYLIIFGGFFIIFMAIICRVRAWIVSNPIRIRFRYDPDHERFQVT